MLLITSGSAALAHPWPVRAGHAPLLDRLPPPEGYRRVPAPAGSFGHWLRRLPLKPGRPVVLLHDGRPKGNQDAQHAVVDIDVGRRDLQQCADAVMRLRAEYLWASGKKKDVCFRFTSGHAVWWKDWAKGRRPKIKGNKVSFAKTAAPDARYASFRKYMDTIFMYAGTASLEKELVRVPDPSRIEIGDVFIRGGFPGHAVIVVDVAVNPEGARKFLLAQSYMPAQNIHVLENPGAASPWYTARSKGSLETPEWAFRYEDLRRFQSKGCPR